MPSSVTFRIDSRVTANRHGRAAVSGNATQTDAYTYDFENRLVKLARTGSGAGNFTYGYDYRTRRVRRNESAAGGNATAVVFAGGGSPVREYSGNFSGNLAVEYVRGSDWGGGVGGVLYSLRASGGNTVAVDFGRS